MRTIAEIPHNECKITIFAWNQKYLIKIEQADLEQTYKISQFDVPGDDALKNMVTDEFVHSALNRFDAMRKDLRKLMNI